MHQDVGRVVTDLVTHMRENPAWREAQAHEGWMAVEIASYFRRRLQAGVAREAPYKVVTGEQQTATKYADVYVQYQPGPEEAPRHLFFEVKSIPRGATSWKSTLGDFAADVERKLAKLHVKETRDLWVAPRDAWGRYLGALPSRIAEGQFIGIGLLFAALDDEERLKRLNRLREHMRDTHLPITLLLGQELPPTADDNDKIATLCLAYKVDPTLGLADRDVLATWEVLSPTHPIEES